jgi:uncharacterized spore protein YtfJ
MTIDVHTKVLSLEYFNNSEEQVTEIYTSLIPVMRGTIDKANNEQNTTEKNEKNQNTRFF